MMLLKFLLPLMASSILKLMLLKTWIRFPFSCMYVRSPFLDIHASESAFLNSWHPQKAGAHVRGGDATPHPSPGKERERESARERERE